MQIFIKLIFVTPITLNYGKIEYYKKYSYQ